MKKRLISIFIILLFLSGIAVVFAEGSKEASAAKTSYPPEMEKWLKEAKLGPYEESPQN